MANGWIDDAQLECAINKLCLQRITSLDLLDRAHQPVGAAQDGVAALQRCQRADRVQRAAELGQLQGAPPGMLRGACLQALALTRKVVLSCRKARLRRVN